MPAPLWHMVTSRCQKAPDWCFHYDPSTGILINSLLSFSLLPKVMEKTSPEPWTLLNHTVNAFFYSTDWKIQNQLPLTLDWLNISPAAASGLMQPHESCPIIFSSNILFHGTFSENYFLNTVTHPTGRKLERRLIRLAWISSCNGHE